MFKATIILSFFNDLQILALALDALESQYEGQFEVLIADDGSDKEVVSALRVMLPNYRFKTTHLWQPDEGFRKTLILNQAIVKAQAPWLIFVDADCVPQRHFVTDHLRAARRGMCQAGRRVNVARETVGQLDCTEPSEIINRNLAVLVRWSFSGRAQAVEKGLRLPAVWADRCCVLSRNKFHGLLGCNFSLSREDLLSVNGFDERFRVQWGAEDSDLERRLRKTGMQFKQLRYQSTMIHFDAAYRKRRTAQPIRSVQETDYYELAKKDDRAWTPHGIVKEDRPDPTLHPSEHSRFF